MTRGWDVWMASPTQWTWAWVNSGSWWWTGRPGMLQFMGLQRVGHGWATELTDWNREYYEVKWKSQFCPTLCNSMDYTVHGILQARILELVDFPFSRGSSQPSIKPRSSALQADSLTAELQGKPREYYIEVKRYCSIFIRHSVLLLESPVIYLNIINCVLICFTLGIFSFSAPLKKYLNLRFT